MCHGSGVACLVFNCMPTFSENQLERYDIRSKQSSEAANREVSDWKLSAGCHFFVFVAQVTSEESYIYANTEKACLNFLYNVLDARPKNPIFFISSDGRSDDTNQTFLRRSPYPQSNVGWHLETWAVGDCCVSLKMIADDAS